MRDHSRRPDPARSAAERRARGGARIAQGVFDLLDEVRHIAQRRHHCVGVHAARTAGDGVDSREVMSQAAERRSARPVL
jgi:hypothetical protein